MKSPSNLPPGISDRMVEAEIEIELHPQHSEATRLLEPLATALIDSAVWSLRTVLGNDPKLSEKTNEFRLATRRIVEGPFHSAIVKLIMERDEARRQVLDVNSLARVREASLREEAIRAQNFLTTERRDQEEAWKSLNTKYDALQVRFTELGKQVQILSNLVKGITQ